MASAGGWIVYNHGSDVDHFLKSNKPSLITDQRTYWVAVDTVVDSEDESFDISLVVASWEQLQKEDKKVTQDDIRGIAERTGCTEGKWLIFRSPSTIDQVWDTVARATMEGHLGISAKVSTYSALSKRGQHVICVYTSNFVDAEDVMRTEGELRRLGITGHLAYKPDIYTFLDIYEGNHWGIKPTVYET